MRKLAVLGFLLLSAPALAGDMFSYKREGAGTDMAGRVITDGNKYRLEFQQKSDQMLYDAIVSKDGGTHEYALNPANRTYYELKSDPSVPTSLLFWLYPLPNIKRSVENVNLDVSAGQETEQVAGMAARRHEVRLSYDIAVELALKDVVRGKVKLEAVYWMAEDKAVALPRLLRPEFHTSFPEIDTRLAEAFSKLRGLPVKQESTIAVEAAQSEPRKETVRITISGWTTAATKPSMFEVPSGFKYHEPVFTRPGL